MKKLIGLLISLSFLFSSVALYAHEENFNDYMVGAGTKFGRGLENIVTSPAEIPCAMEYEMEAQENRKVTGFVQGLGTGTLSLVRRVLVGVVEVGTFMIPREGMLKRVCSEDPVGAVG